jgi:hypothetical protein
MIKGMKWRRETALDIYSLALGVILLAAPWLFSLRASRRAPTTG